VNEVSEGMSTCERNSSSEVIGRFHPFIGHEGP
jgi:hypothetical protein